MADAEGNVASLSTSNGEASGYVVPGTGVMLNNMLGEDDLHPTASTPRPPGLRVSSMMAPTVVLGPGGDVELVLGSGGSARIRTALLQAVSAVVDFGLDPAEVVGLPRIHWDGAAFQVEPGFSADAVAALERLGPVNRWSDLNLYFGGVHAVVPGRPRRRRPRRAGACLTWAERIEPTQEVAGDLGPSSGAHLCWGLPAQPDGCEPLDLRSLQARTASPTELVADRWLRSRSTAHRFGSRARPTGTGGRTRPPWLPQSAAAAAGGCRG